MKIGIFSDTHGDYRAVKKSLKIFKNCDFILHCGDILNHGVFNPIKKSYNPQKVAELLNKSKVPIIFCKGNCDSEVDQAAIKSPIQSPIAYIFTEPFKVLISHGHNMSREDILKLVQKDGYNIVVTGHTHCQLFEKIEGVFFINPGSVSIPLDEKPPSVIILEDNELSFIDIYTGEVTERFKLE